MTYPGTPTRINEFGEVEKQCGKCGEWWPLTSEFWTRGYPHRRLQSPCKACAYEHWMSKPCNVEGCTQPRWNTGTTYCREHHYLIRIGRPPKRQWKPKQVQSVSE